MVTTSIRNKHQQTTDNTKHRTQNSTWVHNRHQHTTSTRRNTHTLPIKEHLQLHALHFTTPFTPTTLHYITTQQTTPKLKKQTTYNTTHIHTHSNIIDDTKIKTT